MLYLGAKRSLLSRRLSAIWTPAQNYPTGTEPGLWYDPTAFTNLYQDSAGTSPATAVGQPAGLMLDQRLDAAFVEDVGSVWTKNAGDGVVTVSGNQVTVTGATTTTTLVRSGGTLPFVSGRVRMAIKANYTSATGVQVWLRGSPVGLANGAANTLSTSLNNATLDRLDVSTGTVTFTITSLAYWRGNHISQPTASSRPIISARVNQLIGTDVLATQSVTVAAVSQILSFTGTGTITLSGASTAGPLVGTGAGNRVSLTFVPAAGTLTLTVTGSVTLAQLEVGL